MTMQGSPDFDQRVLALQVEGYTTLAGALSSSVLKACQQAFHALLADLIQSQNPTFPFGNCRMDLPLRPPFLQKEILANPHVMGLIDHVLGDDAKLEYFASNTAMPGSEYQHVHSDTASLFPEQDLTLPPHALVVNFPLADFTLENGPLEVWPGTHRIPESLRKPSRIEAATRSVEPEQVLLCAGDVLIRDIRMWHRGTPNQTTTPRPMLALVYFRSWYEATPKLTIERKDYDALSPAAKRLLRQEHIVS